MGVVVVVVGVAVEVKGVCFDGFGGKPRGDLFRYVSLLCLQTITHIFLATILDDPSHPFSHTFSQNAHIEDKHASDSIYEFAFLAQCTCVAYMFAHALLALHAQ